MALQPVHEGLGLLRECRTVLLDHVQGLVNVFLDVGVRFTRSDDTLRFHRQRIRLFLPRIAECLLYLCRAQHPDEQIPTDNDYKSCPAAQPVRLNPPEGGI